VVTKIGLSQAPGGPQRSGLGASRLGRWLRNLPWRVLGLGSAGGGRAIGVISVWAWWERLMLKLHRLQPARLGGLFRFRVVRYRGATHQLLDGTTIRPGDSLVELHIDNRGLARMRLQPGYSTWKVVHQLRGDLAAIGARISSGELGPIAAVHAVSLLGPAGGVLGFESRELPHSWQNAFVYYFLAGLDAVYHPAGLERLNGRLRQRWPTEIWMSRARVARLASKA
jgi:hypothetical protein